MTRTRREFLAASLAATPMASALRVFAQEPRGRLLGTVPLGGRGAGNAPLETLIGSGLDARLVTDLSRLTPDTLITPNERFFIRTSTPRAVPNGPWQIRVAGGGQPPRRVALESLRDLVRPAGTHLLECSGNRDPANYGLMSAARWDGIPVKALLDRWGLPARTGRILIAGLDDTAVSRTSTAGASWIFTRDELDRAGAFFATAMNGVPLPPDHGFPVRLVMPGWYGCACIKWVNAVELVAEDAPATPQMREFAARTHQNGVPRLAREFMPATIDHAAMPVRVEKRLDEGRLIYRIVGVLWGGSRPTNALAIRFRPDQRFVRVDDCPLPESTTTWSLWSHTWRPDAPGRYQIVLRIDDSGVRTRRLDLYFYTREVEIDDV
jgi:DMSO/TMAO reductase YedYZ molybdopterin-dependent catalytic subunit